MNEQLQGIARRVGRVSESIEADCLAAGRRLEAAVDTLGALTAAFGRLQAALDAERLDRAVDDLTAAAERVSQLAGRHAGGLAGLDRLDALSAGVGGRVGRMRKHVGVVKVLAINAKIASAAIGEAGHDFVHFALEIGRSLKGAENSIDRLDEELRVVCRWLATARRSEQGYARQHGGVMQELPRRVVDNVEAIGARRRRATDAAATVARTGRAVTERIGDVVMALQIGDSTRQRLEHAAAALLELAAVATASGGGLDGHDLDEAQRAAVVTAGCRLQAAMLADAAEAYEHETGLVGDNLVRLARDARAIVVAGQGAYGGASQARGTFLQELEADVAAAHELLTAFRTARAGADEIVATVLRQVEGLAGHVRAIASLEADIRLMGLNTTLKCARLGPAGKPLTVIAQELRTCSGGTAVEAQAAMRDLDDIVTAGRALAGQNGAAGESEVEAIGTMMSAALGHLRTVGAGLAEALATLGRDGDGVAGLLDAAERDVAAHRDLGAALSAAADELAACGSADGDRNPDAATAAALATLYGRFGARYTMARERELHARIAGGNAGGPAAAAPPPAPAEQALSDMLF